MSIGFQISKSSQNSKGIFGWQFTDDSSVDLTNWSIVYQGDRIICRPKPIEFFYMVFGAVFFLALTIGLLSIVFSFRLPNLVRLDPPSGSGQTFLMASPVPFATFSQQGSARSKYQKDRATVDDIRAATQRLQQRMLEGMSEEERQAFNEKAAGRAKANAVENKLTKNAKQSVLTDRILDGLFLVGKIVTFFVSVMSAVAAMACLRRAILFFTNRLEISVSKKNLCLEQPRLFGGLKTRTYSLKSMEPIHCRSVHRKFYRGQTTAGEDPFAAGFTVWTVLVASRSKNMRPLEFQIERTVSGSAGRPAPSTIKFAKELKKLTGLPLALDTF